MMSSSCSTAISISSMRAASAASFRSSGISRYSNFAPSDSSSQMIARFSTKSTRPLKLLSMPIGDTGQAGRAPETILDHADAHLEVRAGAVELVDEAHPRDLVLLGLAPDGLGLRLDAGNAVEAGDRAVQHAQRTLDFDGEVDVARACR
jgi:hypothetical protein